MNHPTSHAVRSAIVERHLAGETLEQIAVALQLNVYTVRTYWRAYRRAGWAAIQPPRAGPPATGPLSQAHPRVKYVLLRLKRQHPGWGVDKLRLALTRRPSLQGTPIPQRSALAAYLAHFGSRLRRLRRHPTLRPPAPPLAHPTAPHQCWQIDFKGDEPVAGCGLRVAPFLVCDVASGAPLGGQVHVVHGPGNRRGLTMRHVQTDLRALFTRWGLPDGMQMDRDPLLLGNARLEWPGTLMLWLIGLGVTPIINRAYRPTDNAIVERNHQTWQAHVLDGQAYAVVAAIQAATEQAFAERREQLPSRHPGCDGRPFLVAFPGLAQPRRPYRVADEDQLFAPARVDAYLAQWTWRRTVDRRGQISLADHNYPVGVAYRGQTVVVRFDPTDRTCVGRLADGQEVGRWHLPVLEPDYIRGLMHNPLRGDVTDGQPT